MSLGEGIDIGVLRDPDSTIDYFLGGGVKFYIFNKVFNLITMIYKFINSIFQGDLIKYKLYFMYFDYFSSSHYPTTSSKY